MQEAFPVDALYLPASQATHMPVTIMFLTLYPSTRVRVLTFYPSPSHIELAIAVGMVAEPNSDVSKSFPNVPAHVVESDKLAWTSS